MDCLARLPSSARHPIRHPAANAPRRCGPRRPHRLEATEAGWGGAWGRGSDRGVSSRRACAGGAGKSMGCLPQLRGRENPGPVPGAKAAMAQPTNRKARRGPGAACQRRWPGEVGPHALEQSGPVQVELLGRSEHEPPGHPGENTPLRTPRDQGMVVVESTESVFRVGVLSVHHDLSWGNPSR